MRVERKNDGGEVGPARLILSALDAIELLVCLEEYASEEHPNARWEADLGELTVVIESDAA